MFGKENDYKLRYIYHTNRHNNAYLIELNLDKYQDLFNSWDGAALDRKELDPELHNFLERASYELPINENLELSFYLPENKKDKKMEADSRATIKNNFRMNLFFIDQNLKNMRKKILYYVLLGTGFLLSTYLFPETQNYSILFSLILEGLFIGGWVFLWEAASLFFFKSNELRSKKKRYLRYLDSDIIFNYRKENEKE